MSLARCLAIAIIAAAIPLAAHAGTFTTLYSFTGGADFGDPAAQLVYQNGALYGVTPAFNINGQQLGNVFKFDLKTGSLTIVYNFKGGTDGSDPNDLIYHSGMFYGTTNYGGSTGCGDGDGCGTVFSLDPKTGKETVLYSFGDPGNEKPPGAGGLIYESGVLYGVTAALGNNNNGMIFAINLSTGVETTVFSFNTGSGTAPNPSLVFNNGLLYGTAAYGGPNSCTLYNTEVGCGVVFSVDPTNGAESILYAFSNGTDGWAPSTNLIYDKGLLFGGTEFGGKMSCGRDGCGTLFSTDPTTGAENVLHTNTGPSQVIIGLSNHGAPIYETRSGIYNHRRVNFGELVKFNPGSAHQSVLHKFTNGSDGSYPFAPLTYHDGVYYGSTSEGAHSGCEGNLGCGTIFQYVP